MKAERKAEQEKQLELEEPMKDVSNFPEVQDSDSASNQADIPIYGHSEGDETSTLSRTKKRSKRVFDQDNNQNEQSGYRTQKINHMKMFIRIMKVTMIILRTIAVRFLKQEK